MRSSTLSGTPHSRSPIMTSAIENSYLTVPEYSEIPIQQDSTFNIPPPTIPNPSQYREWSFEPPQFPFASSQPGNNLDKAAPTASMQIQIEPSVPAPISLPSQNTSHIHIITCSCHTSLLTQTLQAISSSQSSNNYTYNHHLAPTQTLTIRDLLPFKTLTSSLLSYTLPPQLATLISAVPKSRMELSALPSDLITTLLAHLSFPSIFSTAVLPCLAPTPSQIYTALKQRVYLYLLQHNLFFLVVLTKLHQFYTYYCSFWVMFNVMNLPITFSLGVLRIAKGIVGEVFWGVLGVLRGDETRSYGVASRCGNRKPGGLHRGSEDVVKSCKVEIEDVEEFLVVDVD